MDGTDVDLRRRAALLMQQMPAPIRRGYWTTRRAADRRRRRRLEAAGDFSRATPSQHGLDKALFDRIGMDGGFFVEAGAFDGYTQSNTYFLERVHGWRGLLVEAVPFLAREARKERPGSTVVNCGLVAHGFEGDELTLRYGGTMTVVADAEDADAWAAKAQENMALDEPDHEFTVPARTLSSILDEVGAPRVDLMSLDVEGYEPDVLRGLDLARHAPRFLVVEVDMLADRAAVQAVLGDHYLEPEQLTPNDALFVHRSA